MKVKGVIADLINKWHPEFRPRLTKRSILPLRPVVSGETVAHIDFINAPLAHGLTQSFNWILLVTILRKV